MALRTIALLGIIVCASISDRSATAAPCERVGLYGDPEHCDKFYMCSPCGPLTFYCPAGTYFDRRSEACAVDAQNVCEHSKAVNGEDEEDGVVVTPDTDITFDEFHTSCVFALRNTTTVRSEHDQQERTSSEIRGNEGTSTYTEDVNDGAKTVAVTYEEVSPPDKELPHTGVVFEKTDDNSESFSLTEQITVASVDSLNSSRMRSSDGEDETVTTSSESIQLSKDSGRDCDIPQKDSIKPETSGDHSNKNTDTNVEESENDNVIEDDKSNVKEGSTSTLTTDKNVVVAFEEMGKMDVVFERFEYPTTYNTIEITTTPITISNRTVTDSAEIPNAEQLRSCANTGTYSIYIVTILCILVAEIN